MPSWLLMFREGREKRKHVGFSPTWLKFPPSSQLDLLEIVTSVGIAAKQEQDTRACHKGHVGCTGTFRNCLAWPRIFRSQDVFPRGAGLPQSDQLSPPGKVATRRPAGRRHDGPLCRLRAAHPGPVPAQRAGQSVARQVRAVLRVQLQPYREVLLQGWQALLQNGLFQVMEEELAGER